MKICSRKQCTGCAACMNVCAHHAISMQKGENGHLFPIIDEETCIGCGLCARTCPNNSLPEYRHPLSAYVASAKDATESLTSTSAGIASVLSRYIISQGSVVYGCCGEDCEHVKHLRVDSIDNLRRLKGSKYVQSAIGDTYSQVKKDLSEGRTVLFTGTPCQIDGLNGFLHKSYDNLYTVDVICHGVPSQQILTDAMHAYLPDKDLKTVDVSFRHKENGKSPYGLFVKNMNTGEQLFSSFFPKNEYITGFLCGLYYRSSCYQCHYARPERVSDITVGDYWDKDNKINIDNKRGGLSMLIVNTERGKHLIDECAGHLNLVSQEYEAFVKMNGQLHHPYKKNKNYESFVQDYQSMDFLSAALKNLKDDWGRIRRNKILRAVSEIVYKVPGIERLYRKIMRKR